MDGATFTRELNKYKIVRLADHTKIRWKTQRKSDAKPKLLAAPSAPSTKPIVVGNDDEDFYSMFERINKNILSEKDMKNFIIAMKEEHPGMVNAVNLDDLEHLTSIL